MIMGRSGPAHNIKSDDNTPIATGQNFVVRHGRAKTCMLRRRLVGLRGSTGRCVQGLRLSVQMQRAKGTTNFKTCDNVTSDGQRVGWRPHFWTPGPRARSPWQLDAPSPMPGSVAKKLISGLGLGDFELKDTLGAARLAARRRGAPNCRRGRLRRAPRAG